MKSSASPAPEATLNGKPNRFDVLIDRAAEYQALATENYDRVRALAESIRAGFCAYLAAQDGLCVRLVPPEGPFQARDYGDEAFSMPPRGFRHIAPIAFGLAVRVTRGADWLRMVLICTKQADELNVSIVEGPSRDFRLPFEDEKHEDFYELLYEHVMGWLDERIETYLEGEYGSRSIGFDFSDERAPGDGLAPPAGIVEKATRGMVAAKASKKSRKTD